MHDLLPSHQEALRIEDLHAHAAAVGLDVERSERDVHAHVGAARIAENVESADLR